MSNNEYIPGDSVLMLGGSKNFIVEGHVLFTIKSGESQVVLIKSSISKELYSSISSKVKFNNSLLTEKVCSSFYNLSKILNIVD